jgi:hypothetical protein
MPSRRLISHLFIFGSSGNESDTYSVLDCLQTTEPESNGFELLNRRAVMGIAVQTHRTSRPILSQFQTESCQKKIIFQWYRSIGLITVIFEPLPKANRSELNPGE